MTKKEKQEKYGKYLNSPEWQEKRKAVAKQRLNICESCGTYVKNGYHIHHKTYDNIFNERLEDLAFLCERCHNKIHERPSTKGRASNKVKQGFSKRGNTFHCSCGVHVPIRFKFCPMCGSAVPKFEPGIEVCESLHGAFKCEHCGSNKYMLKHHLKNTTMYCADCKKYIKHLNKKEMRKRLKITKNSS